MATHHREPVVCECGHKGTVHWSESDQPFGEQQWERYSVSGFEGQDFEVGGYTTVEDALRRMNPKCPVCGQIGKVARA